MLETIEKTEREINEKIKAVHKEWAEKYGFMPDEPIKGYTLVKALVKYGVIKDD
jgi:hypothetical protein